MSTWRMNPLALDALEVHGFLDITDPNKPVLQDDLLTGAIVTVFLGATIPASDEEKVEKLDLIHRVAIPVDTLLDEVLPGFRAQVALSNEDLVAMKAAPYDHPDLDTKAEAGTVIRNLLWGTFCKDSPGGRVQTALLAKGLLLCNWSVPIDPGKPRHKDVKFATDDLDLIEECFIEPRGGKVVKVAGTTRDDLMIVGGKFKGLTERMRQVMGRHLTTAVGSLLPVASPDFDALVSGRSSHALETGDTKKNR